MKTKNKKKSIIKKILAFGGAIFCSIVCAFSLFNITDLKSIEVSADEVITTSDFISSGVMFPSYCMKIENGNYSSVGIVSSYFRFALGDNGERVSFLSSLTGYSSDLDGFFADSGTFNNSGRVLDYYVPKNNTFIVYNVLLKHVGVDGSGLSFYDFPTYYSDGFVYCSSDFNCNVQSIYISSSLLSPLDDFSISWIFDYNYVKFIDNNGNYFIFGCSFTNSDNFSQDDVVKLSYQPRLYFLDNNFTDNQYYEQGYSDGQSSGFDDGYLKGEEKGYSDGFKNGKDEGYWEGKQSVIEGEQYSFTSLITSAIDVPVKTFTSLFNFEILGVNLSGFLLGLFTLSVAIFIIKLII